MNPAVLIVSGLYDFSADLVSLRLGQLGVPFLRLNREHLAALRLTLDPLARTLDVRGEKLSASVGPDLRSVWFRQPVFQRNLPARGLSPGEQLERSQWTAFVRALSVFDGAAWMNHPQRTYLAETKPYQLALAAECGFAVPETLVGNDPSAMRERFTQALVIKSLDTVLLRDGDDCLFTYTTIAEPNVLNDANTASAPLLAQRLLQPKADVRVTVVGDNVFAVRILADGAGVDGDWRLVPRERLRFDETQLPASVDRSCRLLAERMGLAFAAIDLLETPEGLFFIEVNPTGEWAWLSTPERPIDLAIARWLARYGER